MSLKLVTFESLGAVSYSPSIVTVAVCVAYAVMRCPSVCLSVRLSRSYILSKRIKISSPLYTIG